MNCNSLGIKRPEREADHSPSSAEVKMRGAIPPLPQYAFMAWYTVTKTAQGQIYLYLISVFERVFVQE
jgi:hypothetical protein